MDDKLTVLEALKWTWIIWRDVAASYYDDEGQLKKSWEGTLEKPEVVKKYGVQFLHACPCCSWMHRHYTQPSPAASWCNSSLCPMMSVWKDDPYGFVACEWGDRSPYRNFFYAEIKSRAEAAQEIADGAWALYLDECERMQVQSGSKWHMPNDEPKKKLDTYA